VTRNITQRWADTEARSLIEAQVNAHVDFMQADALFRLAASKSQRLEALKAQFRGRRVERLFLGARLQSMGFRWPGVEVSHLPRDFFRAETASERQRKQAMFDGAIVLLNNNDLAIGEAATHFADYFEKCANTVFLAWDWDNHHWMSSSLFLAVHSDLYFPAHNENMYLLSRLNWLLCGPVPCGTIQWSQDFLARHLPLMLQSERRDQPLGMHVFYPKFAFRNQVVVTLRQHYDTIGFSSAAFHNRSDDDRLREWCSHKAHWIIPVLNDVPIRIFDALVTGGIPIVPESLRFLAPVNAVARDHIVFYGPGDVLDPRPLVARANALFDAGGANGVADRHRLALTLHHGSSRMANMLRCAEESLGFAPLFA
jgi:hypothetical protein